MSSGQSSGHFDKSQKQLDMYLGVLEEIGLHDKAYAGLVQKIKKGIELTVK